MDQPADSIASSSPLRTQIARICVLDRYLIEALDLQQVEPSLHEHAPAERLVHQTLGILQEQLVRLEGIARTIPGIQGDFYAPSVSMSGLFMRFICKRRARTLLAMLHDDQVMLRLATANYTLLHAIGTTVGVPQVSELARLHLDQLTVLVWELRRLMPTPEPGPANIPEAPRSETTGLPDVEDLAAARS